MMRKAEREIRQILGLIADCHRINGDMPKGWRYHGPADLLLREGRLSRGEVEVVRWKRSIPHGCFRNAALYAIGHGLRYVEGYATAIIPVHHAWCEDQSGKVIEVTWDKKGKAYFGVEFPPMRVTRGSVLFNEQNRSIYRRAVKNS